MLAKINNANIELHVHPFLGRNELFDVVQAMEKTKLDVVAMESLDVSLFPFVVEEAKKFSSHILIDDAGLRLSNGMYILNAREYNTKEGFHLLTVGYSFDQATPDTEMRKVIDTSLKHNALVLLDHPFVDNGETRTAGHISLEKEEELENICKEYSGQIALEWNGYCIPWIRSVLKPILNLLGHKTKYFDVNKKVEELSEKLNVDGYHLPVLTDTDLHARTKKQLLTMGTSRIITDLEGEYASDIVDSMKKNVFSGDYQNVKKYVSSLHLLGAFCVPILLPKYFFKPRA